MLANVHDRIAAPRSDPKPIERGLQKALASLGRAIQSGPRNKRSGPRAERRTPGRQHLLSVPYRSNPKGWSDNQVHRGANERCWLAAHGGTRMKKISKPAPKTSAKKAPVTKQSAAKPKAKAALKPKPRKASGQAELTQAVAQLATSAEKLTQAADRLGQAVERLAEATVRSPTVDQQQHDRPVQPADFLADLTTPGGINR
jgi:hypothetical protein